MAFLRREAVDLVLDRRAIARSDAFDLAGVHRRTVEAPADDLVGPLVGMGDPARQLPWMHFPPAHEREDGLRLIPRLNLHHREIDGFPVQTGGRPGFQASNRQFQLPEPRRQADRGGIPRPTRLVVLQTDVDQAGKEGSGRQDDRFSAETHTQLGDDPDDSVALEHQVVDRLLEEGQIRAGFRVAPGWPACTAGGPPGRGSPAPPRPCSNSGSGTGFRPRRSQAPSHRPAHRSPSPGGPCRSRRSTDCRTSAPASRCCGSAGASGIPIRAAARAASVPAWPPPTTMTSNWVGKSMDREDANHT